MLGVRGLRVLLGFRVTLLFACLGGCLQWECDVYYFGGLMFGVLLAAVNWFCGYCFVGWGWGFGVVLHFSWVCLIGYDMF